MVNIPTEIRMKIESQPLNFGRTLVLQIYIYVNDTIYSTMNFVPDDLDFYGKPFDHLINTMKERLRQEIDKVEAVRRKMLESAGKM